MSIQIKKYQVNKMGKINQHDENPLINMEGKITNCSPLKSSTDKINEALLVLL